MLNKILSVVLFILGGFNVLLGVLTIFGEGNSAGYVIFFVAVGVLLIFAGVRLRGPKPQVVDESDFDQEARAVDELYREEPTYQRIQEVRTAAGKSEPREEAHVARRQANPVEPLWSGTVIEEARNKAAARRQRIKECQEAGIVCCPKCGSTSLSANKKGFSVGKAVAGAAFTPIGVLAGGIGSNKIQITCLNCGYKFKPGKK